MLGKAQLRNFFRKNKFNLDYCTKRKNFCKFQHRYQGSYRIAIKNSNDFSAFYDYSNPINQSGNCVIIWFHQLHGLKILQKMRPIICKRNNTRNQTASPSARNTSDFDMN